MIYEYHFDILALIVCLGIFLMYAVQKNYPTRAGTMFLILLGNAMVSAGADLITAFTISYPSEVPLWLNYLVNAIYLFSFNLGPIFFFKYVVIVTNAQKHRRFIAVLARVLMTYDFLLVATSPWTKLMFYFDENLEYQHGALFISLYVACFSLFAICTWLFIKYRNSVARAQLIVMISYIVIIAAVVIYQFFQPRYLITALMTSIVLVLIYATLERPIDFLYRNTNGYNDRAFYDAAVRRMDEGDQFSIVVFGIENYTYIRKIISQEEWHKFLEQEIAFLHLNYKRRNVFCFDGGLFAVICRYPDQIIDAIREFHYGQADREGGGNWNYAYTPYFWKLSIPDTISNEQNLKEAMIYIRDHEIESNALHVNEFSTDHLKVRERNIAVLHAIKRGLEKNSFRVYYQPIYDVNAKSFTAAEALLRLTDDELGVISPDEFIHVAEKYGSILDLDECVMMNVAHFVQAKEPMDLGVKKIHVNLSSVRYVSKGMVDFVQNILTNYSVSPNLIDLEITERAEFSDDAMVVKNMNLLCENGITFALDDFGTGFSNMNHLMSYPINVVKIDKSLLWQAMKDEKAMKMLEAFIKMIRETGKKSVVEGVETQEMVDLLVRLGCDYLQGFFYSKPVCEEEYLAFLKKNN